MSDEREYSYKHILKYTSLFGSVQGLNILVSLVRNKLVALLLGPSGMGLVSLFNSVVTFISQSTNLGISTSAIKHISELEENSDKQSVSHYINVVRWWCLLTGLFGMVLFVILSPLLDKFTFTWGNHVLHFILLSPVILLTAMAGGELAILKGMHQLKSLAKSQVWTLAASLVITIPTYYYFGARGIVPVIVLMAVATLLLTMAYSHRVYPYRLTDIKAIGEGLPMVKLGIAFMLAGIAGSGAEMIIRAFLNRAADLSTIGLYNAGYMLTFTYAGMVFTAMETDYYPRLSAVNGDTARESLLANRQMEVSLLLISPMLIALIIALPILIPLLFSNRFTPIVPMAQVAVLAMIFKSVTLPIAYLPLARGDSKIFMTLEVAYYILWVLLLIAGFTNLGLYGTGLALVAAHVFDLTMISTIAHFHYGFRVQPRVVGEFVLLLAMALATYFTVVFIANFWLAIAIEILILALSIAFSFTMLKSKVK